MSYNKDRKEFLDLMDRLMISHLPDKDLKSYTKHQLKKTIKSSKAITKKLKKSLDCMENLSRGDMGELVVHVTSLFLNQLEFTNSIKDKDYVN